MKENNDTHKEVHESSSNYIKTASTYTDSGNGLIMIMKSGHVIMEYHMKSLLQEDTWLEIELINSYIHCFANKSFCVFENNYWDLIIDGKKTD